MTDPHHAVQQRVVGAVGAIGLATFASRLLGYARDMVVASAFGAGPLTDAFFVAYRIPNLLRRLLAEGALSTALIPVFGEYLARGDAIAFARTIRAVAGMALLVLVAVSGLGVLLAPALVTMMTPGWTADRSLLDLAIRLTRITFPYLLLVGLGAVLTAALNAHHRFLSAALGPVILNLGMIGAVLLLAGHVEPPIVALAIGVLVGGVGQLAVQIPEARRLGIPLRPAWEPRHPAVRRVGVLMAPSVVGLAAVQLTVLLNTFLASLLPAGTVSYLYYADRVMEFPLGVFGIALATAVLPTMAGQAARGERAALTATLGWALRLSAFIAVPAAVGLVLLAGPIVRLLFERGEFSPADAAATTRALLGYAVGLPAFSAARIAAQTFYALGDTRTPVRVGLVTLAVNVAVALALMWPLAEAGLALASSLASYANLAGLLWLLRRRLGPIGGRALVHSGGKTLAACVPLAAWCLWALWSGPVVRSTWGLAGWTLGVIALGTAIYVAAATLLRCAEIHGLIGLLRRRGQALR
ncbi:MAG: murein biosynthesis integral membrane protein MurJ [Candidatus Rokubacteria bacterium]|nr:murein biosynthesis integral membrane protein MurJ [Candidatus Rokubacteria bacterium]